MKRIAAISRVIGFLFLVQLANAFSLKNGLCQQRIRKPTSILVCSSSNGGGNNMNAPFDATTSRNVEVNQKTLNDIRSSVAEAEEEHRMKYQASHGRNQNDADATDTLYKASRNSFKNVESITMTLLNQQPLLAIGIFLTLGLIVAYGAGYCILCGYISSPNPLENGEVPYWDVEVSSDVIDVLSDSVPLP